MSEIEKNVFSWINSMLTDAGKPQAISINPLRKEASTRDYFRVITKENTYVGVYSPPRTELNEQFIFLAGYLKSNGVTVPQLIASDIQSGFMLVEDFGDNSYQFNINKKNYHELYTAAIDEMIAIHSCSNHPKLPLLSEEKMSNQMDLFNEWFLEGFLDLEITKKQEQIIKNLYEVVLEDLTNQPQVLCHFDFESRNLMMLKNGNTGVLDFQDATFGPIFLDPVSLLRDLYFEMSEKELDNLLDLFINRASKLGLIEKVRISKIKRSFNLTGLQRQLRIMGTLSRLYLRDQKSFRLPDLNQTLSYAIKSSSDCYELQEFSQFLVTTVLPKLTLTLKEVL